MVNRLDKKCTEPTGVQTSSNLDLAIFQLFGRHETEDFFFRHETWTFFQLFSFECHGVRTL